MQQTLLQQSATITPSCVWKEYIWSTDSFLWLLLLCLFWLIVTNRCATFNCTFSIHRAQFSIDWHQTFPIVISLTRLELFLIYISVTCAHDGFIKKTNKKTKKHYVELPTVISKLSRGYSEYIHMHIEVNVVYLIAATAFSFLCSLLCHFIFSCGPV